MKYDHIIPLGEECYTCGSIDSKFNTISLRNCAFPFDYVGHVYIETILEKCRELLLHTSKESVTPGSFNIKLFGENYFFSDASYNFHYWHDITHKDRGLFTDAEIAGFVEKYNRRYDRLLHAIECNAPVLFISVNHYDNIYNRVYKKDKLIELYDLLYKHNPNMHFLAVNYHPDPFTHNTLTHVVLKSESDIEFSASKNNFTTLLNKYMLDFLKK